MSLQIKLNWFREDIKFLPGGACDEGMDILSELGYSKETEYVDAQELLDLWETSDKVPQKYKLIGRRYKRSKEALEGFVLKKYQTLDAIIEMNEFKISHLGQVKTCKTGKTLEKYKNEMIDAIYQSSTQYHPFVYVQGKSGFRQMISPSQVNMYANSKVDIIIEDFYNNELVTNPSEFATEYEKKVNEARIIICDTELRIKRRISDPEEFFEVWVPYSI